MQTALLREHTPQPLLRAQSPDPSLASRDAGLAINWYPNAGSSAWIAAAALVRCALSQSRCVTGSARQA